MADRPRRYLHVLVALVGVAMLGLSACSDDDDPGGPADDVSDEASGGGEQPGDEAFCAEVQRLDVETSEDYGSDQHVADIDALAEVAPDDVRPAVERYRDFLASGAVTDDPESKQTDSWPADVQADIATIQDAAASRC